MTISYTQVHFSRDQIATKVSAPPVLSHDLSAAFASFDVAKSQSQSKQLNKRACRQVIVKSKNPSTHKAGMLLQMGANNRQKGYRSNDVSRIDHSNINIE